MEKLVEISNPNEESANFFLPLSSLNSGKYDPKDGKNASRADGH